MFFEIGKERIDNLNEDSGEEDKINNDGDVS